MSFFVPFPFLFLLFKGRAETHVFTSVVQRTSRNPCFLPLLFKGRAETHVFYLCCSKDEQKPMFFYLCCSKDEQKPMFFTSSVQRTSRNPCFLPMLFKGQAETHVFYLCCSKDEQKPMFFTSAVQRTSRNPCFFFHKVTLSWIIKYNLFICLFFRYYPLLCISQLWRMLCTTSVGCNWSLKRLLGYCRLPWEHRLQSRSTLLETFSSDK